MESQYGSGADRTPQTTQPPVGAPAPRRSNRRRNWLIGGGIGLGVLALLTVCLVAALALGRSAGDGTTSASVPYQEEIISGSGADKIAVLPVEGVIQSDVGGGVLGGGASATPEDLADKLEQAKDDPRVKAIVLEVDSPGGGVVESDQMYNDILEFKKESNKKVVVSMGGTAASGGYYISMAADRVLANRSTITGSLGVIFSFLNYEEAAKKLGLEQVTIKSGPFKDIGAPTRDMTPAERQIFQSLIDESYDQFVDIIDAGRPQLDRERVVELANGRIYSGLQARNQKLVDELGDLERAAEVAGELANARDATVVRYERGEGFFDLLRARLEPGEPEAVKALRAAGLSPRPELQYLYRP